MGLYLAIFDGDKELCGVEVGSYSDFGFFRDQVTEKLENGKRGARYPVLILHSDCEGQWSPSEAGRLVHELTAIGESLERCPPMALQSEWSIEIARDRKIGLHTLRDVFFDIDGEPLIERLVTLAKLSESRGLPILFL